MQKKKRIADTYLTDRGEEANNGEPQDEGNDGSDADETTDKNATVAELGQRKILTASRRVTRDNTGSPAPSAMSPFAGINLLATSTTPSLASPFASVLANFKPAPQPSFAQTSVPALVPAVPAAAPEPSTTSLYMHLRGLNESFLASARGAYDCDPFVDLSSQLRQYEQYRKEIQTKYGNDTTKSSVSATLAAPSPSLPMSATTTANKDGSSKDTSAGLTAPNGMTSTSAPLSFTLTPSTSSPLPLSSSSSTQQTFSFSTSASFTPSVGSGLSGSSLSGDINAPKPSAAGRFAPGGNVANDEQDAFPIEERTNTELIRKGAGEEDEETAHEIDKCKLYRFETEGDKKWVDLGTGILKLNRNVSTGRKRLLARAEGSGNVLLNLALHGSMEPSADTSNKPTVTFFGVDPSGKKPMKFMVRVKTADVATSLVSAIETNVPTAK